MDHLDTPPVQERIPTVPTYNDFHNFPEDGG